MRIWIKEIKDNRLIKDMVVENNSDDTRTHKIFDSLDKACDEWDVSHPIWLDKNVREFSQLSRTKFYQDNFIDEIPFEYMDISVIEED